MLGSAECLLRVFWPEQLADACYTNQMGTIHHKPNCDTTIKAMEGPWADYHFNECGFRNPEGCGPTPPNTIRFAVVGTSLSGGAYVRYEQTFAAQAAASLSAACGERVEFQNLGGFGYGWGDIAAQISPALALKPAAVVMVMMPFDLERAPLSGASASAPPAASRWSVAVLRTAVTGSWLARVAEHYLFANAARYADIYLRFGDKADFLRAPLSQNWAERVNGWEKIVGTMADQAHSAGVPFILALVPQRAQLALMSSPDKANVRPDALDRALKAVADRHGIEFVDVGPQWREIADQDDLYYRVDGHLTSAGHSLLSQSIVTELESTLATTLQNCKRYAGG